MIADVDTNGSGVIDYNEFLDMMTQKMAERDPREEMLKAFRRWRDRQNLVCNFKRVAKELGENMTDDEIKEMIEETDRDGDGEISVEEFMRIMKKTNLFWAWDGALFKSGEIKKNAAEQRRSLSLFITWIK